MIDQKKKAREAELEALDPTLDDQSKDDTLDLEATDWDAKFTPLHYGIFFGHVKVYFLYLKKFDLRNFLFYFLFFFFLKLFEYFSMIHTLNLI